MGAQHRLAVAITAAHFLEARNISDVDVLADIAVPHGFEREEARTSALDPDQHGNVEEEAARSTAACVRLVPHFVFGGRFTINGRRSEDEIASAGRPRRHARLTAIGPGAVDARYVGSESNGLVGPELISAGSNGSWRPGSNVPIPSFRAWAVISSPHAITAGFFFKASLPAAPPERQGVLSGVGLEHGREEREGAVERGAIIAG